MVDNQTSQRSEGLNNHHAQVTAAGDEPNGSINGGDGTTSNNGYLVDVCFGKELNRFIGKLDGSEISQNSASDNALCTFEEFIREVNEVKPGQKAADGCLEQNNAKQRMRHEQQQMAENKPNGREESFKASRAEEKFFEVALSTGGSGGELIRAHYKTVSEGSHLPAGATRTKTPVTGASSNSLRSAFCPTVGRSAYIGRSCQQKEIASSESILSAAYGYDPSGKVLHIGDPTDSSSSMEMKEKQSKTQKSGFEGVGDESAEINLETLPEMAAKTYSQAARRRNGQQEATIVSRIFCCLRLIHSNNVNVARNVGSRADQYLAAADSSSSTAGNKLRDSKEQPQQQYSWDVETRDPKNYCFKDADSVILVKSPNEINGQQFIIENCTNSLIALLDHSSAITVDDCKNCIIITGPCKGSVFIRDCTNCWVLSPCQQFRTRDCRKIQANLFCATSPTIEDTEICFSPLRMNYNSVRDQMCASGLSPFTNRWNQVHNFTPETRKHKISKKGEENQHPVVDQKVLDLFESFIEGKCSIDNHEFSMNAQSSAFFVSDLEGNLKNGERTLILVRRSRGADKSDLKAMVTFHKDMEELVRRMLLQGLRLLKIQSIDVKPGELAIVLQQGRSKNQKDPGGKIVAIEMGGINASQYAESVCKEITIDDCEVTVVEQDHVEPYRKQLYRLCEIQQTV